MRNIWEEYFKGVLQSTARSKLTGAVSACTVSALTAIVTPAPQVPSTCNRDIPLVFPPPAPPSMSPMGGTVCVTASRYFLSDHEAPPPVGRYACTCLRVYLSALPGAPPAASHAHAMPAEDVSPSSAVLAQAPAALPSCPPVPALRPAAFPVSFVSSPPVRIFPWPLLRRLCSLARCQSLLLFSCTFHPLLSSSPSSPCPPPFMSAKVNL